MEEVMLLVWKLYMYKGLHWLVSHNHDVLGYY
jgi:hypothetical protein